MKCATFVLALAALCAAEKVYQTKPGQKAVTLECGIADSRSILKWMRGNQVVYRIDLRTGRPSQGKVDIASRSRPKHDKDLEIFAVTAQDAGLFTCSVNSQQEHHRLVIPSVSVSPAGPLEVGSEAVLRCDVAGLPQDAAVQWVRPDRRREHTPSLTIAAVTEADTGLWECDFSINGKTMKEAITLQVTAPRPKTTTTMTTTTIKTSGVTVTTCLDCDDSPTEGPPTLMGLSWWVWAAVAGGALVLLLWVLILIMYNQMKRRKRRFLKMRKAAQLRPRQYCQCPEGPTAVAGHRGKKPSAPPYAAPVLAVI